jgi:hypothetical protein
MTRPLESTGRPSRFTGVMHDNHKRDGERVGNAQMARQVSSITMQLYRSFVLVVTPSISASSESMSFERPMKSRST